MTEWKTTARGVPIKAAGGATAEGTIEAILCTFGVTDHDGDQIQVNNSASIRTPVSSAPF